MKTRITQSDPMYCVECDTFQSRVLTLRHALHEHITMSHARGEQYHKQDPSNRVFLALREYVHIHHKAS